VLQCVAVCCSVLQCVVVCCSVLQCVAVCCSVFCVEVCFIVWQLKFQSFVLPSNIAQHEHELYILTKQPCIRSRKSPTCALKRALYSPLKETYMCSQQSQSFDRSSQIAHYEKNSVFSQNSPIFALERALCSLSK